MKKLLFILPLLILCGCLQSPPPPKFSIVSFNGTIDGTNCEVRLTVVSTNHNRLRSLQIITQP
jgi:hypothetical protein